MIASFTLGVGQILVEGDQREANLERAEVAVRELAGQGAQVILLPEALNLGWTHPACHERAECLRRGPSVVRLRGLAKELGVYVVAGLVERNEDNVIYNAAVMMDREGRIILHHRKINELQIAHDCYARGGSLGVAETEWGRIGLMICADGFAEDLAISRSLALMGAGVILSPCAWAVPPGFDQRATPYGQIWRDSYGEVARQRGIWIAGCSHVGAMEAGPWSGYRCIGSSLVVGPEGNPTHMGPFDEQSLFCVRIG